MPGAPLRSPHGDKDGCVTRDQATEPISAFPPFHLDRRPGGPCFLAASSAAQKHASLCSREESREKPCEADADRTPQALVSCCPHHCNCQERHKKITLERRHSPIASDSPGSQLGPQPYAGGGAGQKHGLNAGFISALRLMLSF